MLYCQQDVEFQCSDENYQLGMHLYEHGLIKSPNIARDGALITAAFYEYGTEPYRVYIRTTAKDGRVRINGDCSCGTRSNCEHVVAVLMQALRERGEIGESPGHPSQSNVQPAHSLHAADSQPKSEPLLIYRLRPDPNSGSVLVSSLAARRNPSGSIKVVDYFTPGNAMRANPARFLSRDDIENLSILARMTVGPDEPLPKLEGVEGDWLLEKLLRTERCFVHDLSGDSLSPGEARRIEYS